MRKVFTHAATAKRGILANRSNMAAPCPVADFPNTQGTSLYLVIHLDQMIRRSSELQVVRVGLWLWMAASPQKACIKTVGAAVAAGYEVFGADLGARRLRWDASAAGW